MVLHQRVVPFYNMKYTFMIDKIRKVVYSCESNKQLHIANKYCMMLITRWVRQLNSLDDGYSNRSFKVDVVTWLNVIIKRKSLEIN